MLFCMLVRLPAGDILPELLGDSPDVTVDSMCPALLTSLSFFLKTKLHPCESSEEIIKSWSFHRPRSNNTTCPWLTKWLIAFMIKENEVFNASADNWVIIPNLFIFNSVRWFTTGNGFMLEYLSSYISWPVGMKFPIPGALVSPPKRMAEPKLGISAHIEKPS